MTYRSGYPLVRRAAAYAVGGGCLALLLLGAFGLGAPPAYAQDAPPPEDSLVGEPLVWEVVGQPLDEWDLWPDAYDLFFAGDTALYANSTEGLFRIRPGESDFADEPWELLIEWILRQGVYITSTGVLFAIHDGLVRSLDGGYTFEHDTALDNVDAVIELPSGVLIATENGCCGIARSLDEGATWTPVELGDVVTPAYVPKGLAWAPPSPRRPSGVLATVGRDGAAYSLDEGLSWRRSNLVRTFGYYGKHVVYSEHDDTLYAMINGDPGDGAPEGYPTTGLVWASADGAEWELRGRVPTGGDESPGQVVVGEGGSLWAMIPGDIDGRVFSSGDGGRTWADRGAVEGTPLVGNPVRLKRLRLGPDGRLWLGVGVGGPRPNVETGAVLRTVAPAAVSAEGEAERLSGKRGVELSVWPNPSMGTATVALTLAERAEATVAVYDILGREVVVLHEGSLGAGAHTFSFDASALPAGPYLVRASGGAFAEVRRVTVLH